MVNGHIIWNGFASTCKWGFVTGIPTTLILSFDFPNQPRLCAYEMIFEHANVRIWRSNQLGGQYLVQIL